MKIIKVQLGKRSYPIVIGKGIIKSFSFKKLKASKFVIITDTSVDNLFAKKLENYLKRSGFLVDKIVIPVGEKSKTWNVVGNIIKQLAKNKTQKDALIISLGGGVVGDISGFAASIYKRGIRYIHIPTTLLAGVDSSIGGKTGVNLQEGKNLVGTIYQPTVVLIDTEYLKNLPEKDIQNGLAEVIKHAVITDKNLFGYLEKNILRRDHDFFEHIITKSVEIKAKIVSNDEFEAEGRKILNFGHTIGHSIEMLSNHKVSHGEAVAIGMIYETKISQKLGIMSEQDVERLESLLKFVGLPTKYSFTKNNIDKAIAIMKQDKKSKNDKLYFVFSSKIGSIKRNGNIVSFPVSEFIVKNSILQQDIKRLAKK
ncbi:MAG: 3-dehydroquinate synthase [Patescibacteria group bacterium]